MKSFKILSPLIIYLFYVVYLIFFNTESFLTKWLNGSFALFLALVFCNVIRSRIAAEDRGHDAPG